MQVLVCDDDESFCQFLAALFAGEGWEVTTVTSGQACLDALGDDYLPDVLVLDHRMPGLLGLEVAELLRAQGFDRPIVLCSAHLDASHRNEIARLGLIQVNKIDTQAVVRVAGVAVREHAVQQRG